MPYNIQRDPRRNRIYFTPPPGLHAPGARCGSDGDRIGSADEPAGGLAAYLDRLSAQATSEGASLEAYQAVLAAIPAGYGRRHGATLGGEWATDGEGGTEPSVDAVKPNLEWRQIAQHITRYPERIGRSSIAGRVDETRVLRRAHTAYGPVYWEEFRGYDDYRTTLWMPRAMYEERLRREIERLGITPEAAQKWLEQYQGCVGTELYEFAAR